MAFEYVVVKQEIEDLNEDQIDSTDPERPRELSENVKIKLEIEVPPADISIKTEVQDEESDHDHNASEPSSFDMGATHPGGGDSYLTEKHTPQDPAREPNAFYLKSEPDCTRSKLEKTEKMDELLIAAVHKREALWNPGHGHYKNVCILKKLWEEVAIDVEKDAKTVKARWKNLRAYFFKECAKFDKPKSGDSSDKVCKSTWQYYDQLLFLKSKKIESSRDSKSIDNYDYSSPTTNTTEDLQNTDSVPIISTPDTSTILKSQIYCQSPLRKKIRTSNPEDNDEFLEIERKKLEILERESSKEKSDDLLFFESLLPYIKDIPLKRKLRLRSKIQDLILAEMDDEQ